MTNWQVKMNEQISKDRDVKRIKDNILAISVAVSMVLFAIIAHFN